MPEGHVLLTVPVVPPRVLSAYAQYADYLEADAVVVGSPEAPYTFVRAEVEGGRIESNYVVMGLRRADGREVEDLWLSPDSSRVHFRVRRSAGPIDPGPGIVRVVFASEDRTSEVAATAQFRTAADGTLVLPSGAATSRGGIYSGPAGPMHALVVSTDPGLCVGIRHWDPVNRPSGLTSTWGPLQFDIWLDDAVPGNVTAPPRVSVEAGRVHVCSWTRGDRLAQILFDPRNEAGRIEAGRHRVAITWGLRRFLRRTTRGADLVVVVGDDGTTELVADSPPGTVTPGADVPPP